MQSIFLQTPLSNLRGEEIEEARSISKIEKARVGSESRGKAGKQWTGMPAGCCLSRGVRCRKILAVGRSGSIRPWQCISARQGKRAWAHLVVSISDSSTSIWEHDTLGGPSRAYNNESYLEEKDFGVTRNRLHARSSVSTLLSFSLFLFFSLRAQPREERTSTTGTTISPCDPFTSAG